MTTALLLLVAMGFSLVPTGAVVGHIERRGYNLALYQIFGCAACVVVGLAGWAASSEPFLPDASCPFATRILVVGGLLFCGLFNYIMMVFMGRAMKRGPNSIVWAIIQSGLVYPFLMGWLVFGEHAGPRRLCGIAMIVASIFFYASRGGSTKAVGDAASRPPREWLPAALLGMLCCGINQCGANLPSYLDGGTGFSPSFRTLAVYSSLLLSALAHLAIRRLRGRTSLRPIPGELRALAAYASVLGSISFLTSRYLAFPGLDRLERLGAGSMGYPVVVASCIVGFFPYGLIALHERIDLRQAVGAVLGVAGILLGCIR